MRAVRNTLAVLATVLLGAVIGLLGAFQHPTDWTVGDVRFPIGVVAGIAALLLAQTVARDAVPLGLGPAAVLIGWAAVVLTLGSTRPEGDLALPAGASGESFLYGGFLAGLCLAAFFAVRGTSGARRAGR